MNNLIDIKIPSQIKLIENVVLKMSDTYFPLCRLFNVNSKEIDICLREALNNAIIHGNLEIGSDIKEESWQQFQELINKRELLAQYGKRTVGIQLRTYRLENCPESSHAPEAVTLAISIKDQGNGFDYNRLAWVNNPMLEFSCGRGLRIIDSLMDEMTWNTEGNCLTMIKILK